MPRHTTSLIATQIKKPERCLNKRSYLKPFPSLLLFDLPSSIAIMIECILIHIGQGVIQVENAYWELYGLEHGIQVSFLNPNLSIFFTLACSIAIFFVLCFSSVSQQHLSCLVYYLCFFSITSPIYRSVCTLCFLLTFFSFSSDWFPGVCVRSVFSGHLFLLPYCLRDLRFKFDNNAFFLIFIITLVTDKKLHCISVTVFVSVT